MRHVRRHAALLLALTLASCSVLTPKAYDLSRVHEIYAEEWAHHYLPQPGASPQEGAAWSGTGFTRSLEAIRGYQARYGTDSPEAAHLDVLTGMIYIQSGQPATARLLESKIGGSVDRLKSSTGEHTRDSLFALCYADLLDGWTEVWKFFDGNASTSATAERLDTAADHLGAHLRTAAQQGSISADEGGALYLAATAAIFHMWAHSIRGLTGEPSDLKATAAKGRDLLALFLTAEEKDDSVFLLTANPQDKGRLRYLQWYAWLTQTAR